MSRCVATFLYTFHYVVGDHVVRNKQETEYLCAYSGHSSMQLAISAYICCGCIFRIKNKCLFKPRYYYILLLPADSAALIYLSKLKQFYALMFPFRPATPPIRNMKLRF